MRLAGRLALPCSPRENVTRQEGEAFGELQSSRSAEPNLESPYQACAGKESLNCYTKQIGAGKKL